MSYSDEEFPEFAEVGEILRLGPSDVADEQPSMALWNRIEAELSPSDSYHAEDLRDEPALAEVTSLSERRNRSAMAAVLVGIAAALALVALPLGLAYRSSVGEPDFTTELAALEGFTGAGSAELDGRELRVDTMGLAPDEDSFYELWLLDLDGGELNDLRSLGVIEADGTWVIDESIDLTDFDVVDISIEPNDGNPDHSGASVLRGEFGL